MRTSNYESNVFPPHLATSVVAPMVPDNLIGLNSPTGFMPPETQEKPLLLTRKQAAVLLNCSVRTVGRMMFRGELVVRKIGSLTRIPRTSVEAFIRKGLKIRA